MFNLTPKEISMLKEELDFIRKNLGTNELKIIEKNCLDIYKQTEGINRCTRVCEKINEMNKKIAQVQNDTVSFYNNIANLIDNCIGV